MLGIGIGVLIMVFPLALIYYSFWYLLLMALSIPLGFTIINTIEDNRLPSKDLDSYKKFVQKNQF
jgi:hypothetical protein